MKAKQLKLSNEQQNFIDVALNGNNILVDACIGSGKTTSIQQLCNFYDSKLSILYLTYSKLLKIDARTKIRKRNVTVTNYHGFAYSYIKNAGIKDLIQVFNRKKPDIKFYDVLIIDEYQDIEQEFADMLIHIKSTNPKMQIIAVGDMQQKIYDKTTLNVEKFINIFLQEHKKLEFTRCFRLSKELAAKLGRIWQKNIIGVNDNCNVIEMRQDEIVDFLAECNPRDILCLGSRTGSMSETLNELEKTYSSKFNKNTVFASITDEDGTRATAPKATSAIFTTFDSSKGLERKICVVFDYEEDYWYIRAGKPQQSYEILRNIFCVAASRGKDKIIFVKTGRAALSEKTLSTSTDYKNNFELFSMSTMFDFKYREDIEECFSLLEIKDISKHQESDICIKNFDGLIDLSPCIGIYQEAVFFEKYDIGKDIKLKLEVEKDKKYLWSDNKKGLGLDDKILFLVALETKQNRYMEQVEKPFVSVNEKEQLIDRLETVFLKSDNAQVECKIKFLNYRDGNKIFSAIGFADVVKDNIVYELKFVSDLSHEHFLQCASYMVAMKLDKGILINTHNNKKYQIKINNRQMFLDAVTKTITKGYLDKYIPAPDIIYSENVL